MKDQKSKSKGAKNPGQTQKKSNAKKKKDAISGFSTLSQVAGVPCTREYHSDIPIFPVKTVNEPGLICPICGKRIDNIASSIIDPNGDFVHFDCALDEIKKSEVIEDGQVLSYIGSGNFGICQKDENGKWMILKTINYESPEKNKEMKAYVEGLKS